MWYLECQGLLSAGQGSITVPGSIGATPIEAPIDIEEGLPVQVPLVYFFGHATPADHSELYKLLVERLADLLDRRAMSSPEVGCLSVQHIPHVCQTCWTISEDGNITFMRLNPFHRSKKLSIPQACIDCSLEWGARYDSSDKPTYHLREGSPNASALTKPLKSIPLHSCTGFEPKALLTQVVGAAGMLINTMGWVDGLGFELLLHTITAMKANIVLVVGEDRLLTQLQTKYQVCTPTQQAFPVTVADNPVCVMPLSVPVLGMVEAAADTYRFVSDTERCYGAIKVYRCQLDFTVEDDRRVQDMWIL